MQHTCLSSHRSLTRPHNGPDSLLFPFYSSRGYWARGFKIAQARDPLRNRASTTLVCAWSFSETLVALRPPCNPLILESRVILANPLPFCPSIPRRPVRQIRPGHTSAILILSPRPQVHSGHALSVMLCYAPCTLCGREVLTRHVVLSTTLA